MVEQFWGRAVRASHDSKELWGAFNFCELFSPLPTARLHLYNLFRMYNSGQLVEIEDFLMLASTPFAERRFEA